MDPLQNPIVQIVIVIVGACAIAASPVAAWYEQHKIKEHRDLTGHDGSQPCDFVVGHDTCCYIGRKEVYTK